MYRFGEMSPLTSYPFTGVKCSVMAGWTLQNMGKCQKWSNFFFCLFFPSFPTSKTSTCKDSFNLRMWVFSTLTDLGSC